MLHPICKEQLLLERKYDEFLERAKNIVNAKSLRNLFEPSFSDRINRHKVICIKCNS